jgi:N-methylhydantoinase A
MRLGIDVGGTFTDLVALSGDRLITAKVPSTPYDQSDGAMRAVEAAGIDAGGVTALAHGMTVATNALLERTGARTAFVTTEGFRDLLELGRQARPSLYDLTVSPPVPLAAREHCFTVRGRMGPEGEIAPLDDQGLAALVDAIREAQVESVAVCLLFAFLHPEHERRVGAALRETLPGVHVSLSSEVLPEFREYERAATTTADAYLGPRLAGYLGRLAERTEAAGLPRPTIMRSSGGVVGLEAAARSGAACVLSGPAGGVVGAAHAARASGYENVLTFDMGGTSTDVAPVRGGAAETTTETEVAGVPIKLPTVDVHTVSAGGGSIAEADAGGALRVGPRSAGADPGPAAYGRGGEEPTVTDADLFLGYLADGAGLGGSVSLDRGAAEAALSRVGGKLELDALDTARGVVAVAEAEMVRALRVISVQRGLDPREFALVAFGGAGGMHACALAEELGMSAVLVPRASGVLSALGLVISDERRDYQAPLLAALHDVGDARLEEAYAPLERAAREELADAVLTRRADLRYRGQAFELTVDAHDAEGLAERFTEAHERRYGYRIEDEPIEVVSVRVVASVAVDKPALGADRAAEEGGPSGRRTAFFDGEWCDAPVFDRASLGEGSTFRGPALVELADATCVVRPGWSATVDGAGTLVLERDA